MDSYIKIRRIPYEEPWQLELNWEISNGRMAARFEVYIDAEALMTFAAALENFPRHKSDVFLYESGSEKTEDCCAYYFRLRVFTTDSLGHCAIQIRFNNNRDLPYRELMELCIETEAAQINRLGQLFRSFALLKHERLIWSQKESCLTS